MQILWPSEDNDLYIPIQESSLCIGYDGLGAVDGVLSDVTSMAGAKFSENPVHEEMRLAVMDGVPEIRMRRAVRRFDFYHLYKHNLLILSQRAFDLVGQELVSSVDGFRPVECHFGTWSGRYFAGKLRFHAALTNKLTVLPRTTFFETYLVSGRQTAVEKGERDLMDESHVLKRGLHFETVLQVMEAKDYSTSILLEDATMAFPEVAMFNYGVGVTYLRLSVFQKLLTLKHPQRHVLGIVGSQPFANVHFTPG